MRRGSLPKCVLVLRSRTLRTNAHPIKLFEVLYRCMTPSRPSMHIPTTNNGTNPLSIRNSWLSITKPITWQVISRLLSSPNVITHKHPILRPLQVTVIRLGIIDHFQIQISKLFDLPLR
jgi:hypothetical protein